MNWEPAVFLATLGCCQAASHRLCRLCLAGATKADSQILINTMLRPDVLDGREDLPWRCCRPGMHLWPPYPVLLRRLLLGDCQLSGQLEAVTLQENDFFLLGVDEDYFITAKGSGSWLTTSWSFSLLGHQDPLLLAFGVAQLWIITKGA